MNINVSAEAPSNIALIKYMGKTSTSENKPSNPSLSWSIDHLRSRVDIVSSDKPEDSWQPLNADGFFAPELSEKGQQRFVKHFQMLKQEFGIEGFYIIRSANNFPSDCGVASSASSFAALTLSTYELAKQKGNAGLDLSIEELSSFSRRGSGSSCRSLFPAWSYWETDCAEERVYPLKNLEHTLVMVDAEKKQVSSSEAHVRVTTSPHFIGRVERAQKRLDDLDHALILEDWSKVFDVCLDEFEDMHLLFETSVPAFSYRNQKSKDVVQFVKKFWKTQHDGPVVTMDAGANIHLLWRQDQLALAVQFTDLLEERFPFVQLTHSPNLRPTEH